MATKIATLVFLRAACFVTRAANPLFVTSDPNGGWSEGGYYVHNNMIILAIPIRNDPIVRMTEPSTLEHT
jgi:hypothetical protein